MTNADLERLVSETIEPHWCGYEDFKKQLRPHQEYWVCGKCGIESDTPIWTERHVVAPWLTDDRYAMRLFDEMGRSMSFHGAWELVQTQMLILRDRFVDEIPDYRRRAIVLAWLKWKGKI